MEAPARLRGFQTRTSGPVFRALAALAQAACLNTLPDSGRAWLLGIQGRP